MEFLVRMSKERILLFSQRRTMRKTGEFFAEAQKGNSLINASKNW